MSLPIDDHPTAPAAQAEMDLSPVVAALDVGSNSFHMVIAKRVGNDFQILERPKQQVQLAAGLDADSNLDEAAFKRAYQCLDEFAAYLEGVAPENIKAVATHTLRIAHNADEFLKGALKHFPVPIRVISGLEEARLIYQGVVHISDIHRQVLVVDIGGGSTEFAIGREMVEKQIHSAPIGCVNLTKRYFADGRLSLRRFGDIEREVARELEAFRDEYLKTGWELCLGSSGSIKSIMQILKEDGFQKRSITLEHLLNLKEQILSFQTLTDVSLSGLQENRAEILPAAIAMLIAIFKSLEIQRLEYSRGALREGLLYDTARNDPGKTDR